MQHRNFTSTRTPANRNHLNNVLNKNYTPTKAHFLIHIHVYIVFSVLLSMSELHIHLLKAPEASPQKSIKSKHSHNLDSILSNTTVYFHTQLTVKLHPIPDGTNTAIEIPVCPHHTLVVLVMATLLQCRLTVFQVVCQGAYHILC